MSHFQLYRKGPCLLQDTSDSRFRSRRLLDKLITSFMMQTQSHSDSEEQVSVHIIKPDHVRVPFSDRDLELLSRGLRWIPSQPMVLHASLDTSFEGHLARSQIHYSPDSSNASKLGNLPPSFSSFAKAFVISDSKNRSSEDLTPTTAPSMYVPHILFIRKRVRALFSVVSRLFSVSFPRSTFCTHGRF